MLQSELAKLRADVAAIKLRDFHLGNLLDDFVTHLAHAHGLDDTQAARTGEEEDEEDKTVEVKTVKGKR